MRASRMALAFKARSQAAWTTDLIGSLRNKGVDISNQEVLENRLASAVNWQAELVELVARGRRIGVTFAKRADCAPLNQLERVLTDYGLSDTQAKKFIMNLREDRLPDMPYVVDSI